MWMAVREKGAFFSLDRSEDMAELTVVKLRKEYP